MSRFFELFANNVRSILAVSIVYLSFGFLFLIARVPIPTQNQTIINIATGLVLGLLVGVGAYYYGASKDKSDTDKADSMIEKKAAGIDV